MPRPAPASTGPRRRVCTVAVVPQAPPSRHDQLRSQLLGTVDSLQRRRVDLVPEALIADYVALDWLEWNGGTLRTTVVGANVCRQMKAALE
jgi:hypothetical protein